MFRKVKVGQNTGYEKSIPQHSKKRKVLTVFLTTVIIFCLSHILSSAVCYQLLFLRVDRPDYSVMPGNICYQRVSNRLYREEFFYQAGENKLKGYYYPSKEDKGLVVAVHGFKTGADSILPLIEHVVNRGFNVFSYDGTGTYESEGESSVGMVQALVDLDHTLNYIKNNAKYRGLPLFLMGFSRGGYAVSSVLALQDGISACACLASLNDGSTIMTEKAEQYVGFLAYTAKPVFDVYQNALFDDYTKYNGVNGINSVDIPVIVAHGVDDKTVTFKKQSIISKKDEITNKNVVYFVEDGINGGHRSLWHSENAVKYQEQVEEQLRDLKKQKGRKLSRDELIAFYNTVDHSRYSEVNLELMNEVIYTFEKTL